MHYSIAFPAQVNHIPALRDMVYNCARLQEFPEEEAQHMKSVADELLANAIEYGSKPTSEVTFEITANAKMIQLVCRDQGQGQPLTAKQIEAKIIEPILVSAMRGRGLSQIVKNFVSDLEFRDRSGGGIIATAILKKE